MCVCVRGNGKKIGQEEEGTLEKREEEASLGWKVRKMTKMPWHKLKRTHTHLCAYRPIYLSTLISLPTALVEEDNNIMVEEKSEREEEEGELGHEMDGREKSDCVVCK